MAEEGFDLGKAKKTAKNILIGSAVASLLFIFIGILEMPQVGAIDIPPFDAFDYFIFSIMAFMGPYGIYRGRIDKTIEDIEKRLPDFLRDVAEAGRFGMTLADAIVVAASGRYGKLTPEIKKMAAQIQWGVPATQALKLFADRIDTPLVRRVTTIVIKSSDAGGNVADVLSMVSHSVKEVHHAKEELSIEMVTYLAVIYISFMVFIATILILDLTFLPQMETAGNALQSSDIGGGGGGVQLIQSQYIPEIKFIFTLTIIIHGVGDGLVAGILYKGTWSEGMKHAFIMVFLGFMSLRVMFGGLCLAGGG